MGANAQANLSEYASNLIKYKARRLVGRHGLTRSDRGDLEQELALHVMEHMDQFDSQRGGRNTFVDRILDHKIISILRQRFAQRRDYRRTISCQDTKSDDENDQFQPVDQRIEHVDSSPDLAIDLTDAIAHCDNDTQQMCGLLMHESIAETARQLGLTRGAARGRIAILRKLLTDAGLKVYLNEGTANFETGGVCKL